MQIVHFGHACVLLDTGSARLLFDPGVFSTGFEALRDLDAILITHQHEDHADPERLPALAAANPTATMVTDSATAAAFAQLDVDMVEPGDSRTLGSAEVNVVGGEHAVVHPDLPMPPNNCYVVDHGAFYHPGDSLFVPEQRIDVLGVPASGPWLKFSEAVDFVRAVRPRAAVPIHQEMLGDVGKQWTYRVLGSLAPEGCEVRALTPREPTDV